MQDLSIWYVMQSTRGAYIYLWAHAVESKFRFPIACSSLSLNASAFLHYVYFHQVCDGIQTSARGYRWCERRCLQAQPRRVLRWL